jgi:hypothetical protein
LIVLFRFELALVARSASTLRLAGADSAAGTTSARIGSTVLTPQAADQAGCRRSAGSRARFGVVGGDISNIAARARR